MAKTEEEKRLSKNERQAEYAKRTGYAAQNAYDKENSVRINFKFNKKTDADILSRLAEQENKSGYIKRLIREDIEREKDK